MNILTHDAASSFHIEEGQGRQGIVVSGPLAGALGAPVRTDHLHRMSDDTAVFEHAEGALPRLEHGYCTDDVSRALVVVCAMERPTPQDVRVADRSLAFLRDASVPEGRFRSRMSYARMWSDSGESDDASGRALLALGFAARRAPTSYLRSLSLDVFERAAGFRSEWMRSSAFATIGACDAVVGARQGGRAHTAATRLALHAAAGLPHLSSDAHWRWPEPRLAYANAALPEALLALARSVDPGLLGPALDMLDWLTSHMVLDGRISPPPSAGWTAGEPRPGFDQQPIEVVCLARAAWAAWDLSRDTRWLRVLVLCGAWFLGVNDTGVSLLDPETGGCCDGLMVTGRNENQGAESTLAWLETALLVHGALRAGAVRIGGFAVGDRP